MSDDWSGLGWNPTPGHPHLATNLANNLKRTAETLQSTFELLDSLSKERSYWTGEASKAFAEKVEDLPDYLQKAHNSLKGASGELAKWGDGLHDMKVKARHYEEDAKEARKRAEEAMKAYQSAKKHPDFQLAGQTFETKSELDNSQHRLDSAQDKVDAAVKKLNSANGKLKDLIDDAKSLERRHSDTAQDYADAIRKHAKDHAPDGGFWAGLKDWWDEHGGDLLTIAATIVGIAAIFVLPLAPLAVGLSLAAAAQHTYQYAKSGKDIWPPTSKNLSEWATLGGDLLGVVPGVGPAVKGAKAAITPGKSAFTAARGAGAVARTTSTVTQASKTGARHFWDITKAADPSDRVFGTPVEWALSKLPHATKAGAQSGADLVQAGITGYLAWPTAQSLQMGWSYSDEQGQKVSSDATDKTLKNDMLAGAGASIDPLKKIFSVAKAL